jgi:uncharacterized protein YndB with AHSA1/START domain/uncharacterized protein YciI
MIIEPVRKSILVRATPEHTFATFAAGAWWPKGHSILPESSPRVKLTFEPPPNGRWYETGTDGTQCDWGKVLAWDPPRRILLGWQLNGNFEYDPSATLELEVNFTPEGGGTRVNLEHRDFELYAETGQRLRDSVGSDDGWSGLLSELAKTAETVVKAAPRYFVCKLITPRPTFMQDMSEAEGAALGAHVGYWTALSDKGQALVFGPVGDPAGVWGLGILTAPDEATAQKIAAEDPAITSGLGFKCEVFPMLRTIVGKM